MIKPVWRTNRTHNDHFTEWMNTRSRMSMPSLALHALETSNLAVEEHIGSGGRKLLRTETDAIAEMKTLGGHMFFAAKGAEAFFGWESAIVKLEFRAHGKEFYVSDAAYHGMVDGPLEKIRELSQGWFGKKIRSYNKKYVPETEVYMLARSRGNFGLISIGSESEPFVPGNYEPKVVDAFNFCKKSLLARVPAGRLVLLDGPPGTGKTRFVRALMSSLHNAARVIVVPEHLTPMLADPDLIPVLKESSDDGDPIILILEDADDCLKSRDETEGRGSSKALSSLLNLSDGIVGAMLDLRIVATTNVRITKLDPAIMRPGRLLSRVEFGPLDATVANGVLHRLTNGKGKPILRPRTLAEVYAEAEALTQESL